MATDIKSQEISIDKPAEKVHDYLSDLNNYKSLMPSEVNMYEVENDVATLHVDGLGKFQLAVQDSSNPGEIILKPSGKLPFDFDIVWKIGSAGEGSNIVGVIRASLNPFIKMIAEPKLRSFVDSQAQNMKDHLESSIA